jgi:hypothetical protein
VGREMTGTFPIEILISLGGLPLLHLLKKVIEACSPPNQ